MKEKVTLTVDITMKNYVNIKNLIGYCKYNNLIISENLPTTDEEIINAALFSYFEKIETIVRYYNVDKSALNLEEGTKIKNRIKEILKMTGMKQKELSELTGIETATLSAMLSNRNQPSIENFLRIWTVLGCPPIEEVFYREKE